MKKHLIILVIFLTMGNLFAQSNNGWRTEFGPEINFTEGRTLAIDSAASKNINITSLCLSAGLMKNIFSDNIYVGGIYSFGRVSYKGTAAGMHKYTLIVSVITGVVTFFLVQEYFYAKLKNAKVNGSGLGAKIAFTPFKNKRLNIFASANQKNQALGLVYTF